MGLGVLGRKTGGVGAGTRLEVILEEASLFGIVELPRHIFELLPLLIDERLHPLALLLSCLFLLLFLPVLAAESLRRIAKLTRPKFLVGGRQRESRRLLGNGCRRRIGVWRWTAGRGENFIFADELGRLLLVVARFGEPWAGMESFLDMLHPRYGFSQNHSIGFNVGRVSSSHVVRKLIDPLDNRYPLFIYSCAIAEVVVEVVVIVKIDVLKHRPYLSF